MGDLRLPWLNGGELVRLPGLPIVGHREIVQMQREMQDVLANRLRAVGLYRMFVLVTIREAVDRFGVEAALRLWGEGGAVDQLGVDRATTERLKGWTKENFVINLESHLQADVYVQMDVSSTAEARKKIHEEQTKLEAEFRKNSKDMREFEMGLTIAELWWRLRNSHLMVDYDGQPTPLTRERLEHLVRYPEDVEAFHRAKDVEEQTRDLTKALRLATVEEVAKNSTPPNGASTASSPSSASTSTASTATSEASSAPVPSSG